MRDAWGFIMRTTSLTRVSGGKGHRRLTIPSAYVEAYGIHEGHRGTLWLSLMGSLYLTPGEPEIAQRYKRDPYGQNMKPFLVTIRRTRCSLWFAMPGYVVKSMNLEGGEYMDFEVYDELTIRISPLTKERFAEPEELPLFARSREHEGTV